MATPRGPTRPSTSATRNGPAPKRRRRRPTCGLCRRRPRPPAAAAAPPAPPRELARARRTGRHRDRARQRRGRVGALRRRAGGVVPRAGPAPRGSRLPRSRGRAREVTKPTLGRRGRTGIAWLQRRRAPAQPSPALAAAARTWRRRPTSAGRSSRAARPLAAPLSAPPPEERGKGRCIMLLITYCAAGAATEIATQAGNTPSRRDPLSDN